VTGASSGIGAAMARELAARGHGLTLAARRADRMRDLADEISSRHGVRVEVVAADLADADERERLAGAIEETGLAVQILVNNAGFGAFGDFAELARDLQREMVRLNVEAVVDLQARYLPAMVERGRGAVINVASTAGFQPLPANATYAATKAFVLNLSEATHEEVKGKGVTLTCVCPGPVRTEFVEVAGRPGAEDRTPGFVWITPEQVAAQAVRGAKHGTRVVVPGMLNRATTVVGRHAPRALSLPLTARLWRSI
jgi:short-subunit dehydrogenase